MSRDLKEVRVSLADIEGFRRSSPDMGTVCAEVLRYEWAWSALDIAQRPVGWSAGTGGAGVRKTARSTASYTMSGTLITFRERWGLSGGF